jgi:integrase
MRRGELCTLRWENVDFDEQAITVQGSYAVIPGKVWLKKPKSRDSRRINLPNLAIQALKRRARSKPRTSSRPVDSTRMMATCSLPRWEAITRPTSLYKVFAREARRAGLALTKLHAARHSYATWLIANGVDIATVSKLLGHSEITTTLRVYAHTIKDCGKEAVLKIDEQLAKAHGNRMATEDSVTTKKA